VDDSGNVYVTGQFYGSVDFDPSGNVDMHNSNGFYDAYLTKFDSTGTFQWAKTWGGSNWDYGHDVGIDSDGYIYTVGWFAGTVDFNPGSGSDPQTATEDPGAYLTKFDSSGTHQWARTWGGSSYQNYDFGLGVAVDGNTSVYVAGRYINTVDFDPGPGTVEHTSIDYTDAFLSKFNTSGDFQWVNVWGGNNWQSVRGVGVDSNGYVSVLGHFNDTVDMDPGPGTLEYTASNLDVFTVRMDSSGTFEWARVWGAWANDRTGMLAVDRWDNVFVTGILQGTADLAPSYSPCFEDPDMHSSSGECDAFVIKYLPDGCW